MLEDIFLEVELFSLSKDVNWLAGQKRYFGLILKAGKLSFECFWETVLGVAGYWLICSFRCIEKRKLKGYFYHYYTLAHIMLMRKWNNYFVIKSRFEKVRQIRPHTTHKQFLHHWGRSDYLWGCRGKGYLREVSGCIIKLAKYLFMCSR